MISLSNSLQDFIKGYFDASLLPQNDITGLSERSWKQMLNLLGESETASQCMDLVNKYPFYELVPTHEEWREQLTLAQMSLDLPFYILHISFSSPVMFPGRLALSSLLKLYDREKRQQVRIKISGFTDPNGQLWWEVGFVHTSKTFNQGTISRFPQKQSYYLLSGLVANTFKFMKKRSCVNGIHLSPAYYHIWPLSLRIASQYKNTIIGHLSPGWLQKLKMACAGRLEIDIQKTESKRNFEISRMLQAQELSDQETGETLHWQAPAIVILQ